MSAVSGFRSELRAASARRVRARRRRVAISLGAAVVAVVTGSLAIAATSAGWLTGEPAPPQVVEGFRQYTPQLGFHPRAGKAQFVAQDGPIKLYATTNRKGGICYLVDEPWKPANAGDGGTCASREKAAVPISAGLLGSSQSSYVIGGRVADKRARTVSFAGPDGARIVRPLGAGGFYVAQVPWHGLCLSSGWNPLFVAFGADGEKLGKARILLLQASVDSGGKVRSCAGESTPHGPYTHEPSAVPQPPPL
jgi:hypothetical protein